MKALLKDFLVNYVAQRTRSFGGGKQSNWGNPIAKAMEDRPPMFAAGVDIGEVVEIVLQGIKEADSLAKSISSEVDSVRNSIGGNR